MPPRTQNTGHRFSQRSQFAHDAFGRVLVAVPPSRDCEDRDLYALEVVAHARPAPIFVPRLMRCPRCEPKVERADALAPHLLPAVADHERVGWHRQPSPHRSRPARLVVHHRAAHIMNVVVETIVGTAAKDDRLERGGTVVARRHHQRVDRAPRFAHHSDVAVAEREPRNLLDRLHARREFVLGVLIGDDAVGVAAALKVNAKTKVFVEGEPRIHHAVNVEHAVAAPVRVEIDDRRKPFAGSHRRRVIPVVGSQRQAPAAVNGYGELDLLRRRHDVERDVDELDRAARIRGDGLRVARKGGRCGGGERQKSAPVEVLARALAHGARVSNAETPSSLPAVWVTAAATEACACVAMAAAIAGNATLA